VAHVLEEALDQEVFPQGEGVPWGSMEEGVHHDTVAFQGEGVSAYPCGRDLQNKKKIFSLLVYWMNFNSHHANNNVSKDCPQRHTLSLVQSFNRETDLYITNKQTNLQTNNLTTN